MSPEIAQLLESIPLGAEIAAFIVAGVALATAAAKLYKSRKAGKGDGAGR